MPPAVHCRRCARDAAALSAPPFPGRGGEEIHSRVCADCWREWQRAEVMVINELKLNFMDPTAQQVLDRHMRDFLLLDSSPDETSG